MKTKSSLLIVTSIVLAISLAGCDVLPFMSTATPTATATPTFTLVPPSPTPNPATDTPTNTPTLEVTPTATFTSAPQFPTFTPTNTPVPTKAAVVPLARVKFQGTFPGGKLVFRTGPNGASVVPKTVTLKGAQCSEGKTISDTYSFEPPTFFWIIDGKFTIVWGSEVTISGVFLTETRASGTLKMTLTGAKGKCTISTSWIAEAVLE